MHNTVSFKLEIILSYLLGHRIVENYLLPSFHIPQVVQLVDCILESAPQFSILKYQGKKIVIRARTFQKAIFVTYEDTLGGRIHPQCRLEVTRESLGWFQWY